MGVDPARGFAITPEGRALEKHADHEHRIGGLERAPRMQVGSGAPTADPKTLRASTKYLDFTNSREYTVVGDPTDATTNVWKSVLLT